jgi:hypothetical protein
MSRLFRQLRATAHPGQVTARPMIMRWISGVPSKMVKLSDVPVDEQRLYSRSLLLWVPKTYATRRYSWMTPPARSRRWIRN